MELLLVPVPLFDKYMGVESYLLRYRFSNQSMRFVSGKESPLLQALEYGGVEAFAGGNPVFVPVEPDILPQLVEGYTQPAQATVFLLEETTFPLREDHLQAVRTLKGKGYSLGITQGDRFIDDDSLLPLADYVVFGKAAMDGADRRAHVLRYKRVSGKLRTVATGLNDKAAFERAQADGFQLFEGMFYRVPTARKDRELTPIKANLIRLLNLVRDEEFEFREIADVLRQDPALSYSLMRFINSPYLGIRHRVKSIQHAVTILGQIEVRKWVTAAVFKELGADRPSELTRISLLRARFAESLGKLFGLSDDLPSLFLMGLFSALDVMLDTDMQTALSHVLVTDEITDALARHEGRYYPVLELMLDYERADWQNVIKDCMVGALDIPRIYSAYLDAVGWYHDLLSEELHPRGTRSAR